MVQNVASAGSNSMGTITRIGNCDGGRCIYEIKNGEGKVAGKMSVAQQDCDKFEKAYNDLKEAAPKLQQYVENTTPEKMAKKQKQAKWIVGGTALLGGLIPAFACKGAGWLGALKKIGCTVLGTAAGLFAGSFIASKTTTPPGAAQISKATQTISKLDIQPVKE